MLRGDSMNLNISRLTRGLEQRQDLKLQVKFESIVFHNMEYKLASPVDINGSISRVGNDLKIKANIVFKYNDNCARCLKKLEEKLSYDIDTLLIRENFADEVSESESDVFFYEGEELDIYELLIHSLEFIMPAKVLCSEQCKGICPHCGVDLNLDTCDCENEKENEAHNIDPRFAKLQELLKD